MKRGATINRSVTVKPSGDGDLEVTVPPSIPKNNEMTGTERMGLNQKSAGRDKTMAGNQQNHEVAESQKQAQGLIFKALAEGNLEDRKESPSNNIGYNPDRVPPNVEWARRHGKASLIGIPDLNYNLLDQEERQKAEAKMICPCCGKTSVIY